VHTGHEHRRRLKILHFLLRYAHDRHIPIQHLDMGLALGVRISHLFIPAVLQDLLTHILIRTACGHVHQVAGEQLGKDRVEHPLDAEKPSRDFGVLEYHFG
jgi:hypothetical protein